MSASAAAGRHEVDSNIGYLNGRLRTGAVSHEVVLGTNGFQWRTYGAPSRTVVLGNASISDPVVWPEPDLSQAGSLYHSGSSTQQSLIAGDTVTFSDAWSVTASVEPELAACRELRRDDGCDDEQVREERRELRGKRAVQASPEPDDLLHRRRQPSSRVILRR